MAIPLTDSALLELPLFEGLSANEVAGLSEHLSVEECPRGTRLFRRGDAGEALYVVLSGQVALELGPEGALLALCGPGDWFGELALLTSHPRTADARIAVDATLLRIDRAGWSALSQAAPRLFARLCERLGRHLRVSNERVPLPVRSVVACGDPDEPSPPWIPDLAASLRRQFPKREICALGPDGTPLDEGNRAVLGRAADRRALGAFLARVTDRSVLILAPFGAAERLADRSLRREDTCGWSLTPGGRGRARERIGGRSPEAALDRAARHLAGGTVGLALGAGGAYGLAHLGVFEVLESAGVPIDRVAGTSIGAIVGGIVAAGVSPARAVEYFASSAPRFRSIVLRDVDLSGHTLLTGERFMELLAGLEGLEQARFESLAIPFAAVAMDVASGERVLLDAGPLLEGIRPSFAMPGVFPACSRGDRLLIDGAMVDPVPVDVVRSLGADAIVACQPIPPLGAQGSDPVGSVLLRAHRLAEAIPVRRLRRGIKNLGVSLRSFQALWYQLAAASSRAADVLIEPELGRFWFLQFGDAGEIIEAGRRSAAAALPGIRAALEERLGLSAPG
jgi:NTE family protein